MPTLSKPILLALSMLVFMPSLGFSQVRVRGFRWWSNPKVQRELALTAKQATDIETEFSRTLGHRRLLRRKYDAANAELTRALARGDLSEAAAEAVVTRVEDLRRQRNVARMRLLVTLYFLLTPEQRKRLSGVVERTVFGIPAPR